MTAQEHAAHVARIAAVGTAVAGRPYSQQELLDTFRITDPRVCSIFHNSAIRQRYLTLPAAGSEGIPVTETQGDLLSKHKAVAIEMGTRAVEACLKNAGATPADISHLCCVTSTGFLTPGLSALLIRDMGISPICARADIVGMGCNAGLNGLALSAAWSAGHPGQLAVLVCVEVCSAAYIFDGALRTAVVNSLFGDGAGAVALISGNSSGTPGFLAVDGPRLLGFAGYVITDALDAMRFDWDDVQGKFSFFLDPDIPFVVGAHVELVVDRLLAATSLRRNQVSHWLVHSGGKKVIDAVRVNLGLTRHELRHTTQVLRDYGNLSSGSFLFSYERLLREGSPTPGDYGVMMTMGPGSTIETALIQW